MFNIPAAVMLNIPPTVVDPKQICDSIRTGIKNQDLAAVSRDLETLQTSVDSARSGAGEVCRQPTLYLFFFASACVYACVYACVKVYE